MPDVFQIIVKEKGVFTNVTSPSTKAKLRILFEVAPLALMVSNDTGGALRSTVIHAWGGASGPDAGWRSASDV